MPVFTCIRSRSNTATPVVSLPVPAVVGIANSGRSGPGTASPLPIGGFDVVEKVGGWMRRVEVGDLGRVDRRAAADGDEGVAGFAMRHLNRIAERCIGRLDPHVVVEDDVNLVALERLEDGSDRRQLGHDPIGDDHHPVMASLGQVPAKLTRHADAVAHRRCRHLERNVAVVAHAGEL